MGVTLLPKGSVEICTAPPLREGTKIVSKGAKTTRICFDLLPEEVYRVAGTLNDFCHCNCVGFWMWIDGRQTRVWL